MSGADKPLLDLGGKTILSRITETIEPQVLDLTLNVRTLDSDLPQIRDRIEGDVGPLAGLHACLSHAREMHPDSLWILTVPGDTPFLPRDLVARLWQGRTRETEVVVAKSGGRLHPLTALWRTSLTRRLERAVVQDSLRSVQSWIESLPFTAVTFEDQVPDPFFNVNSPEDLEQAAQWLGGNGTASLDRTGDL